MILSMLLACAHAPLLEASIPTPPQLVQRAEALAWKPCPPVLPDSCRQAVLEGDPSVAGQLFTTRLRIPEAFRLPSHTHPAHERLTVLEGDVRVRFLGTLEEEEPRVFGPHDYYVTETGAPHEVWSEAGATVQVTGIGPWVVTPWSPPEGT